MTVHCGGRAGQVRYLGKAWLSHAVPVSSVAGANLSNAENKGFMGDGGTMTESGRYAVKLVRGPCVRLATHDQACEDEQAFLSYAAGLRAEGTHLAADLFSGGGGLSLGLEAAGYRVVLAVDNDAEAVKTHRHHFAGLALDWDLGNVGRAMKIAELMAAAGVELLAGGPPCQPFSRAGRSKIRHRVRHAQRDSRDERKELWHSFLDVVQLALPRAVVMENVPDMALDREMYILRMIVHELEGLGYAVERRIVDTWRYGVPQFRQRLICVALRDGVEFRWPAEIQRRPPCGTPSATCPRSRAGWRQAGGAEGWAAYEGPVTQFQHRMRIRD